MQLISSFKLHLKVEMNVVKNTETNDKCISSIYSKRRPHLLLIYFSDHKIEKKKMKKTYQAWAQLLNNVIY